MMNLSISRPRLALLLIMLQKFGFEKLPEDLLLRILVLTDIHTVLTISQLLTKDLFLRDLVDIHSDEVNLSLSSDELVAQVRRAAGGPRTWAPDSPTAPTLIQQFAVQVGDNRVYNASLLPGGRYMILRRHGIDAVECYNVSTGRRVWSWGSTRLPGRGNTFHNVPGIEDSRLLILDVDLESGHSDEMLQFSSAPADGIPRRFKDP
ncbi:hypothetical protein C8R45DRAFT_1078806 [Mycena sanguinolenta]|nr:hypothetical protein C8R45DRAFT_1078806 [Mycena sanguinolenta]